MKQLYPRDYQSQVLELNASDDRGIGVVRERIVGFASTRTMFNTKFKFVILDEADAMTNDAQNALRRVMEKYTENTRFCLICNYLSKIIPAIQSRSERFLVLSISGQFQTRHSFPWNLGFYFSLTQHKLTAYESHWFFAVIYKFWDVYAVCAKIKYFFIGLE